MIRECEDDDQVALPCGWCQYRSRRACRRRAGACHAV